MKWLIAIGCALSASAANAVDIQKLEADPGWSCMRIARPAVVIYEAGIKLSDDTKKAIEYCIRADTLWPYDKAELKRVGLYDQLASTR